MGYSDQERANIALVTAYRSVPMAILLVLGVGIWAYKAYLR